MFSKCVKLNDDQINNTCMRHVCLIFYSLNNFDYMYVRMYFATSKNRTRDLVIESDT